MPEPDIVALGLAGVNAAQHLIDRFVVSAELPKGKEDADGWQRHRTIRFRTFMGLLEELVVEVASADAKDDWSALSESLVGYQYPSSDHKALARAMLSHLKAAKETVDAAKADAGRAISLQDKAPNPRPSLRTTPNY